MDTLKQGADALFILLGAIMVLAMHAGFAFLELGTVRKKNQVNALVKILVDFAISTIAYFFVGYSVAYGVDFFSSAEVLAQKNGYDLVKFFFLLTFAAAIPAIISGGIAERARFHPQSLATVLIVALVYPLSEGVAWNQKFGVQAWLKGAFGAEFHDFAGSVVVHAVGGWIALAAVLLLGARSNRYRKDGAMSAHPPSSIPFLALGSWVLAVGWSITSPWLGACSCRVTLRPASMLRLPARGMLMRASVSPAAKLTVPVRAPSASWLASIPVSVHWADVGVKGLSRVTTNTSTPALPVSPSTTWAWAALTLAWLSGRVAGGAASLLPRLMGGAAGAPPMPENRLPPVEPPSPALKLANTPSPPPVTPPVPWLARPLPVPELLPPSTPGFIPSSVRTDNSVGVPGRGKPLPVASPVSWVRSGG